MTADPATALSPRGTLKINPNAFGTPSPIMNLHDPTGPAAKVSTTAQPHTPLENQARNRLRNRGNSNSSARIASTYAVQPNLPPSFEEESYTSPPRAERRKQWSFYILADGRWVWRVLHPDSTEACSAWSFPNFAECSADAQRLGYVAVSAADERRKSAISEADQARDEANDQPR